LLVGGKGLLKKPGFWAWFLGWFLGAIELNRRLTAKIEANYRDCVKLAHDHSYTSENEIRSHYWSGNSLSGEI
jgi:hypothetical protein